MEKLNKLFEQKYGAIRGAQTKLANDLGIGQSTVAKAINTAKTMEASKEKGNRTE